MRCKHTHFSNMIKFERSIPLNGDSCAQAIKMVLEQPIELKEGRIAPTFMRGDA